MELWDFAKDGQWFSVDNHLYRAKFWLLSPQDVAADQINRELGHLFDQWARPDWLDLKTVNLRPHFKLRYSNSSHGD